MSSYQLINVEEREAAHVEHMKLNREIQNEPD